MSIGIVVSTPTPTKTNGTLKITVAGPNEFKINDGDLMDYENPNKLELQEQDAVACAILSGDLCRVLEIYPPAK